ncbi:hypothetical protein CI105_03610 [Candidatus Izimaplasma bacterium ZiA1]|uniref:MqnA/MqnD/SBP family protein n=1 Tax=Candidatus Izimoplasma sp. ZiA1 TaxID=2024899 RepID=UPI000BAA54CE|nr:hypothetical protein CI105_03610 [Candidatus Izimaplasma bacterium ZiA1]
MKKITILMLSLFIFTSLVGCKNNEEKKELRIIVPLGSPALAQTYNESTLESIGDNISYTIDVIVGSDPLVAAFGSGSHDIIYAPTNLGAKLISSGLDYKFAATVVFGNLYLATGTGIELTMESLDGKNITVFGQNATPEIILNTIINEYVYDVQPTFTYVDSASQALADLITDNNKIVLLAEPMLSVASLPTNVANITSLSLQDEWGKMTESTSYPQAGIFVKSSLDKDIVDSYLSKIEESVNYASTNTDELAQLAVDLEYGFPLQVLKGAIPRSGLMFMSALDSKTAIELYFTEIMEINSNLIGGSLPDTNFYYQPND